MLAVFAYYDDLPNGEDYQKNREYYQKETVGDEHDPEGDDYEAHQYDGEIGPQGVFAFLAFHTDEERREDGGKHPGEFHEQLGGHPEEVLVRKYVRYSDGEGEDDDSSQKKEQEPVLPEKVGGEVFDLLEEKPDDDVTEDRRDDDVEEYDEGEPDDHRAPPFTEGTGFTFRLPVFVRTVFPRLTDVVPEVLQNQEVVVLPFNEYLLLDEGIPFLGVVVGVLEVTIRFRIVGVVLVYTEEALPIEVQNHLGVVKAAVPFRLGFLVQFEGVFLDVIHEGGECTLEGVYHRHDGVQTRKRS